MKKALTIQNPVNMPDVKKTGKMKLPAGEKMFDVKDGDQLLDIAVYYTREPTTERFADS